MLQVIVRISTFKIEYIHSFVKSLILNSKNEIKVFDHCSKVCVPNRFLYSYSQIHLSDPFDQI